ncbi:non-ribosomal peptide synthetase [Chitinophaga nivalis]|uniref:Amino acid adenylation domain-containing protein n=1 Tax=Chitinophaga nivalis TaxID=2991709 RepID=A0ABT3IK89_9BACT|nr:non-ribosomal peptide synthetase [Chitinophaga nivalis]MCW3465926.1 amino acid adenylation domain-containing protein [Chitinophaga nivalis]MCW3484383.1 amino acid adenylation domain-containing protein [Chitinophaga nivalis]
MLTIFNKYKSKGIIISLDTPGENLSLKGNLASLTAADKDELKQHKEALINFMKAQRQARQFIPQAVSRDARYPLSPGQKSIWVDDQLANGKHTYIIPAVYRFSLPGFTRENLIAAAGALAAHTEILRTVIRSEGGEPYHLTLEHIDIDQHLSFIDYSSHPDPETPIRADMTMILAKPLAYEALPPWQMTCFMLPGEECCLLLKIHHLIADGESLGLMVQEMMGKYDLVLSGKEMPTPKDTFQFRDFVNWINDKNLFTPAAAFWQRELSGFEENAELPALWPEAGAMGAGNEYAVVLAAEVYEQVMHYVQEQRIHLSALLTACYSIVVSKYTGSRDFVIGTPAAGRSHAQLQTVIGDFVNVLPVRVKMDYTQGQHAFIAAVQQTFYQVLEHQLYPFEYILEDIGYQHKGEGYPLFNVMISFPNNLSLDIEESGLHATRNRSMYDLTCTVIAAPAGLKLVFEYKTSKFSSQAIARWAKEMEWVLTQLIQPVSVPLSAIKLLTPEEETAMLLLGKGQEKVEVPFLSVPAAFVHQVLINPAETAVIAGERRSTYEEIYREATKLAINLQRNGVRKGDRVVTLLPASTALIELMWGIWFAEAVYVPVDPEGPAERTKAVLEDCTPALVVDGSVLSGLRSVAVIPDVANEWSQPDDMAYLLYTSGSTGIPKGVMVSHRNLVCKLFEEKALLAHAGKIVTLSLTSPVFDVAFLETVFPLICGGTVVVTGKTTAVPADIIIREKVTLLQGTPTYFTHFISELQAADAIKLNATLKIICIGGESLNEVLLGNIKKLLPDVCVNNHYGPTEITIDAVVNRNVTSFHQNIIGKPIGNTGVMITDSCGNLLPVGVAGELLITGPSVAAGYWNRDALTAAQFRTHPLSADKVYCSGDLARWTPDGNVAFIGRKDRQVKLRGYRIELEEITHVLKRYPLVTDAFSGVIGQTLVSWIVCSGETDETLIRHWLKQQLPDYMIPSAIAFIDHMPGNSNNKVDTRQLPVPATLQVAYVAPRNRLEEEITAIWQEVLQQEQPGIYANFFELGGHSLKLMKLINRYAAVFNVALNPRELFNRVTIESHAWLISRTGKVYQDTIERIPEAADYAVSFAQKRIWVLSQLDAGSKAYHMPTAMRLAMPLNVPAFLEAMEQVVARHEMLRTVFLQNSQGELRQRILQPAETGFKVDYEDYSHRADAITYLTTTYFDRIREAVFPLDKGPLLRAGLFRTGPEDYLFLLNMHHIISDGWSMEILIRDVLHTYGVLTGSITTALPPLEIQYRDYAAWHNQQLSGDSLQAHRYYWQQQLAALPGVLDLPGWQQRPVMKTYNGAIIPFAFSETTTRHIHTFIRQHGGSLFMCLLAGLNGVLYRYTRQTDMIIGTPMATRNHAALEDQIGFYINTLALRSRFAATDSFAALYEHVKQTTLDAYNHQQYPFDKLVDDLRLPVAINRNPLFDIMLVLQNTEQEQHDAKATFRQFAAGISYIADHTTTSHFDITLLFTETEEGISGTAEYNTDIYQEAFVAQLLRHLESFINKGIVEEDEAIATLDYLQEEDKTYLLQTLNNTDSDYARNGTVISLFESQVESTPDHIALVAGEITLTYRQLNEWSNRLAYYLVTHYHIRPDDLIGMKPDRDEWMIITVLGILKSGAAYVPIDPQYPEERIRFMEQNSGCRTIIDSRELAVFRSHFSDYSERNPEKMYTAANLAYIIYTSGSTGNPKGVMMEHRQLNNLITYHRRLDISYERVTQFTSISFDVSFQEIFFTITRGGTLHVLSEATKINPELLIAYVQQHAITTLFLPTSFFRNLGNDRHFLTGLKTVSDIVVAGEQLLLSPAVQDFLQENTVRLHNHYGPAEAHVVTTYTIPAAQAATVPPIGKPIANTRIYILDELLGLQPNGTFGYLYIGGDAVARGYLNREDLTAERFIADPFGQTARLYRTGDLGRWLPDGNIEFLGRNDDQVKIRGFRVELGEIESQLLQHPFITAATVMLRKNEDSAEGKLVAYLVSIQPLTPGDVKAFLLTRMPRYMVPDYYSRIDSIPLTSNGKVNRALLPEVTAENGANDIAYTPPATAAEKKLTTIWQHILGIGTDRIGVDDDFFELGGHSLKVISLLTAVRKTFGVAPPLTGFYRHTTIRNQALLISHTTTGQEIAILPAAPADGYTLSPSQLRIWLVEQLTDNAAGYTIGGSYPLDPDINPEVLRVALDSVIRRHEILRTIFGEKEGVPHQLVKETYDINDYLDIHLATADEESVTEEIKNNIAGTRFNLETGPLLKLAFVNNGKKAVLFFNMHHIISDGWSMEILLRDLFTYYDAAIAGEIPQLPPLPIQYKDYAAWLPPYLAGEKLRSMEEYWIAQLSGTLPLLRLPADFEQDNAISATAGTYEVVVDATLHNHIRQFILEHNSSLFGLFIAACKIVLSRLTGLTDIITGIPVANRDPDEVKDLIGCFLNTLMLRDKVDAQQPFVAFLQEVNNTLVNGLENQAYPFEQLLDKLQIDKHFHHFPVSPVFLNMLNFNNTVRALPENYVPVDNPHTGFTRFDLECYFEAVENGLIISCTYKNKLFKPATIASWMNAIVDVLQQVMVHPAILINEVALFREPVERTLMPVPRQPFVPFEATAVNQSVVARFEEIVQRCPDNVAVNEEGIIFTYATLNACANGLATRLMEQRMADRYKVALLMEHGIEAIIGMLAVLKAGLTYVPLDPHFPVERLVYILEDIDCGLMIASPGEMELAATITAKLPEVPVLVYKDIAPEEENIGVDIAPDSPAYILYTSGSTGQPKGVIQLHGNILHFIRVYTNNLHIDAADRLSLMPAYTFDAAVMDIYGALLNGASLYPYDIKQRGLEQLGDWLTACGISIVHTVPTIYRYFISKLQEEVFENIRLVVLGGEAVYKYDFDNFKKHFGSNAILINGYGPTESTITLQKFLDHHSVVTAGSISIGYPVTDTQIYLLHADGRLAGIYEEGEIVYKSKYLAQGYLNKPEQTAKVFTTDPFTGTERVYRSGDLGRLLPNGEIEFIGRKDNQVKLNGQRVELPEIELQLLKIPLIAEAVVVVKTWNGEDTLVAYLRVVAPLETTEVKRSLAATLPAYMVPARYVLLEQFPLTATGKISRMDLPEPAETAVPLAPYVAPVNNVEATLVDIWSEVLQIAKEKISTGYSFFDLGGNSIKLIKANALISRAFNRKLPVTTLFNYPNIHSLAAWLGGGELAAVSATDEELDTAVGRMEDLLKLINDNHDEA